MTERTPTPWRVGANSFGTQFIYGNPDQPRTSPMGVTYNDLVAGGDHPGTLTEANAAFIVKAVNNFDALVEALKAADNTLALLNVFPESDPRPQIEAALMSVLVGCSLDQGERS